MVTPSMMIILQVLMDVIVIWYHTDIRAKFHGVTHGLMKGRNSSGQKLPKVYDGSTVRVDATVGRNRYVNL